MRPRTKLRGRFLTHKVDGLISLDWQKKSAAWRKKMCRAAEKWKSAARQIFARHNFSSGRFFYPSFGSYFARIFFLNVYALPALFFLNIFESWPKICRSRFSPRVQRDCFKTADFQNLPRSLVRGLRFTSLHTTNETYVSFEITK